FHRVRGFAILPTHHRWPGPFHGNSAICFVHQIDHVRATHGMNGHAFAARDIPDDGFAANRIATSGAIDEQIVVALYFDRAIVSALAEDAPHHRPERADVLRLLCSRLFGEPGR